VTFLILSYLDILEDLLRASISVASTRLLLFSVSLHDCSVGNLITFLKLRNLHIFSMHQNCK